MAVLKKVTVFILRRDPQDHEGAQQILLFRHPNAGVQIPAGTVESNELVRQAALREAREETGLADLRIVKRLGVETETLPSDERAVVQPLTVYARPDPGSFAWAHIPRGIQVSVGKQEGDFIQVAYVEWDSMPEMNYITYQISGWAKAEGLASRLRRYFYLLAVDCDTPPTWEVAIDHHLFHLFWAPLDRLPEIIPPQDRWLRFIESCRLRHKR